MNGIKSLNIIFLLFIGLILRVILANLEGFKIDVDAWFAWALRINEVGFANFYSSQIWTNYTPGYLYVLGLLGFIKNLFSLDSSFFYLLLKIPSILSELILGVFIYRLSSQHFNERISIFLSSLVFLNPAFIFNSAIWGQIDGLLSLFMVFSIYYLIQKNLILSSVFFSIALLIKPQALAITPVFFLYLVKNFNLTSFLKLSLPAPILFTILSFPFFPGNPIAGLFALFQNMINDYSYTSLFAYNLWGIVGFWINDTQGYLITYKDWGIYLLIIYWLVLSFVYFKKNIGLFTMSALATLGFYFLPTRVHERYLYHSLIFLILAAIEQKSSKIIIFQILLSLVHFLNLYYVYIYYNELYLNLTKVLYNQIIYEVLNNSSKIISSISTLLFILAGFIIIKPSNAKKTY